MKTPKPCSLYDAIANCELWIRSEAINSKDEVQRAVNRSPKVVEIRNYDIFVIANEVRNSNDIKSGQEQQVQSDLFFGLCG